ncbi:MAG: glycosyltransferase family 4 protein [Alphaproteobacteria bacterium]|nr:glycosyltransferase family 4 protein [Alphaproteobacteria bacterium]MBT5541015.1 glycosyltransferase family 4 protein [Alphaproteobacteria bacterium]
MDFANFFPQTFLAMCLSALFSFIMIKINIHDVPNERSSHMETTPKAGGVAIALSFFLMSLFGTRPLVSDVSPLITLWIAALVMMLMGLWDDINPLTWKIRLGLQLLATIVIVSLGISFENILLLPGLTIPLGPLGSLLTAFWLLYFINMFNFMDGINGIAAVQTIGACFFLFFLSSSLTSTFALLAFASLGFLFFNFPKSRLFLGDSGSQFLGFLLPVLGLMIALPQFSDHPISPLVLPVLFFNFIYDTLFTLFRRTLRKEKIWDAHREHLYQRLNQSGWSHTRVTCLHVGFMLIQGFTLLWIHEEYVSLLFIPLLGIQAIYSGWVLRKEKHS